MEGSILGYLTAFLIVLDLRTAFGDRGRVYMETSPEPKTMPLDDEALLTCEMNLLPDTIQWRFYPLNASDATDPRFPILLSNAHYKDLPSDMYTNEKRKSMLGIKSSSKAVAGDYQCLAHYGASVVASVPGRVTVTSLGKFPHQNSTSITVTSGNTVVWRCEPPQSNPPAVIDYYKNGVPVSPNIPMPRTESLIIPDIGINDSGVYTCVARNIIENNEESTDCHLKLNVISHVPQHSPRFVIPPKRYYTVNAGDSVFMECSAVGTPTPQVYWFKRNSQLPPNRTKMIPGGLQIFNVTSTDDGVYVCNHTNSYGTLSHHITLVYNEAPTVTDGPNNRDVKEGENLDLDCTVKGTPEPQISWFLNGRSVINDSVIEAIGNRIYFRPVQKRHAGILQCFASNLVGTVYSSANLKVIPLQIPNRDDYSTTHSTISYERRNRHNKARNHFHKKNITMTPPSKPVISRLNDESVMVRWSVPENSGLPIQFFKVQYRELGPINHNGSFTQSKGSRWKTTNSDIAPHIGSYEVNNLKPDYMYRFRIAAVYSNNDNKLGPNSAKFHLNRADFSTRNPLPVPRLTHTESVNETSIRIFWEYAPPPNISVDGFFVNYISADSAGDYMKATVDGENARAYVISHLQPDTLYDIKLQSFTSKLASEFSPILKQKTAPSELTTVKTSVKPIEGVKENEKESTQMYIFIGAGVLGVALLLSVIVLLIVCRKWKQKKDTNLSVDGNHGDKDDASHHIQADANDYVVSPKSLSRSNGCAVSPSRITITPNPLADADNKNQNMIELSCLTSQNNNCSQPSVSNQGALTSNPLTKNKIKNRDKSKRNKLNNAEPTAGENYV